MNSKEISEKVLSKEKFMNRQTNTLSKGFIKMVLNMAKVLFAKKIKTTKENSKETNSMAKELWYIRIIMLL